MSDLLVAVRVINEILPHPNADKLEIAVVGGWQVVVGKGDYQVGDSVVHIPPEVMVPLAWADTWGVTKYLNVRKGATEGRVKAARLRGVASYGFLVANEGGAELGENLAEKYGITKYEPPEHKIQQGQMRESHPLFHQYTNMDNLRNYPEGLNYDYPLVVTEKLHGTNSRVGIVRQLQVHDSVQYELIVGTHRTQRKLDDCGVYGLPLKLHQEAFVKLFDFIIASAKFEVESVIVFGEIFGPGVQDLAYGQSGPQYAVFDIAINGRYIDYGELLTLCSAVKLPMVPPLFIGGRFKFNDLCQIAEGSSMYDVNQIREGIVVRPINEMLWKQGERDPNPGRMIFKVISADYLTRKAGTEFH